ncbi:hypothetical protein C474_12886 [Halogeometricum pallidum JCM 14848]|uniref:Uncharacterized protein n=1 Tax=Halogeometricum pallidum JCM 14848 TaxID=1227487 RepID=M0D5I0_HALPD|nr:hypothetical protein [Halogeometricum pallidum]ELZ29932.1 hypothetical protein C474_12886 [Halogeometricum pallidum JCM 14848]
MNDDVPHRPTRSRRGVLALASSAALAGLAGCSGLDGVNPFGEDDPPTIDASALEEALSGETPTVPEPLPVDVEAAYVDRRVAESRESLSSIPAPFDAGEVPNGMIREEFGRLYDRATESLDRVSDAASPADALEALRYARRSIREVEAAWAAVDSGLTAADLEASVPTVREAYESFRERWRYVGDDPVRAVLVHAKLEELVADAGRRLDRAPGRTRHPGESALGVGEFAADLEAARAAVEQAGYLFDRFESSLASPRSVREELTAAGERLSSTLAARRDALSAPGPESEAASYVEGDAELTPVAHALADLRRSVEYADDIEDERKTGQRARVVVSALRTLTRIRAFESLRERVENEAYVTVENAADVRAIREAAVEAVGNALDSAANPLLVRSALRTGGFDYVADRLHRYDEQEEVSVTWLTDGLSGYVVVEATALATPETAAEAAEAIRSTR